MKINPRLVSAQELCEQQDAIRKDELKVEIEQLEYQIEVAVGKALKSNYAEAIINLKSFKWITYGAIDYSLLIEKGFKVRYNQTLGSLIISWR